jgi:phosphoglycolate phosphatase
MANHLHDFAAVLFDFDGTLADSYEAIAASVNHVRAHYGLPALATDEVKRHVGRGAEYLLTNTVPGGNLHDDLARYRAHHPSVLTKLTYLLPGTAELIPALHGAGKKLGLCSNKPRIFSVALLDHFQLGKYFDAVLGPGDVPLPKPAPDMVRVCLDRLGVPNESAVYVGDMTVDIQTARAAGVEVWAVATGSDDWHTLKDAKPDRLLTSLQEIVAELARM